MTDEFFNNLYFYIHPVIKTQKGTVQICVHAEDDALCGLTDYISSFNTG